jgi:hypothetical protein
MSALDTLAAALRGDARTGDMEEISDRLVDLAVRHGVEALLARAAAGWPAPPAVAFRLKAILAGHEALAALRAGELARVLEHLASGGVCPIVIKGAHLAHALYPSHSERPHHDTDLVIAEEERATAAALLAGAGYRPLTHVRGTLILGQWHFQRTEARTGLVHALDLHWRLAAPLVFRRVLPVAALRASRVAIPGLGPHAWGPSPRHALLIACVHLVAHHRLEPALIWLYDIARLADALDDADAAIFVETAAAARITAVCAAALDRARRFFDTPALTSLAARARAGADARPEPSAGILTCTRPVDELWLDLRASDGWPERLAMLREHLLPDPGYMRATSAGTAWLPFAYARRAIFGARKWIRPAAAAPSSSDMHE